MAVLEEESIGGNVQMLERVALYRESSTYADEELEQLIRVVSFPLKDAVRRKVGVSLQCLRYRQHFRKGRVTNNAGGQRQNM